MVVGFFLCLKTKGKIMKIDERKKNTINEAILKDIRDLVEDVDYGTVLITIHNQKISQVEVSKKQRFDSVWKLEGGAGI